MAQPLVHFVVERAAEPLSQRLEQWARQNRPFKGLCVALARAYNSLEYKKRLQLGWMDELLPETPFEQPKLSEDQAIESGCTCGLWASGKNPTSWHTALAHPR